MFARNRRSSIRVRNAAGSGVPAATAMIAAYCPNPSANQIESSTGASSHWNGK